MRPAVRSSLALIAALVGTGCAAESSASVVAAHATGSVGVLQVERLDGEIAGRTVLGAAFARYRGVEAGTVLGLLGSGAVATPETCVYVGAQDRLADSESAAVELLDVGTLHVRVSGTEARLSPRAFPDLASMLAGVVYAGEATLATPRADVDEYAFRAADSEEIAAFEAVVPAPASPAELRVDGHLAEALQQVSREAGLEVSWAAGDPRDTVEIEVHAHGDVFSCAAIDDGSFRLDADALSILAPDTEARLVVRRVRVTPVDVPSIEDAFARVTATRTLAVELR